VTAGAEIATPRRITHAEAVWGTVVVFDIRDPDGDLPPAAVVSDAITRAVAELHWVDEVFSPFRADSLVSRTRQGAVTAEHLAHGDERQRAMAEVMHQCEAARRMTGGAFDPWALADGFDPSGLVKGWAADRVANLLVRAGIKNLSVNAGGDVVNRGRPTPAALWRIGVRHPDTAQQLAAIVTSGDEIVATSAGYERGDHVHDPVSGRPARGARSATVVGPEGGLADALATALLVSGRAGAQWFERLPGWSAFVVDPAPAKTAWSVGPHFTDSAAALSATESQGMA